MGEEFGAERRDAEYVWVLDPIDGTRAFMAGLPLWGTLIGLTRRGAPAYGLMHQPFTGERFFGDGGSAAYRGRQGDRTGTQAHDPALRIARAAILSTTSPNQFDAPGAPPTSASRTRPGSPATAAIATPIACWPAATSTS